MKKIILATVLTLSVASAMAQNVQVDNQGFRQQQPANAIATQSTITQTTVTEPVQLTPISYPGNDVNQPKTRAEVRQELIQAEQSGTMPVFKGR